MAVPTVFAGLESGYTASVINVRQLEDYLDIMDPDDYPLLQAVGLQSYDQEIYNTRFEWQVDYLVPTSDTLDVAITTAIQTVWDVTHPAYFNLHDVVMADTELVRVISINVAGGTITVERAFAGSTPATHLQTITVYRLGPARPEGSSPGWAQQTETVQPYNYTQIWDATAEITGTEEAMKNYAPEELLDYRIDKRMRELYVMMEMALFHGLRFQPATNTGRSTGGLNQFITDNDALGGAALVFADIEDALSNIAGRAGMTNVPTALWCNSWVVRKITSFGVGSIRTARTETIVGNTIDSILTNFGTVNVNYDRLVTPGELYLLAMDRIMVGPMRGRAFASYRLSIADTLDDQTQERILGEYGFIVKGEDGTNDGVHCRITGISTTT